MINDKLFEKRLNAAKVGEPIPEVVKAQTYEKIKESPVKFNSPPQVIDVVTNSIIQRLIIEIFNTLNILIVAILYGYGIRGIFAADWNFLETAGIGLILSHIITRHLPKLYAWFKKLFTKKSI